MPRSIRSMSPEDGDHVDRRHRTREALVPDARPVRARGDGATDREVGERRQVVEGEPFIVQGRREVGVSSTGLDHDRARFAVDADDRRQFVHHDQGAVGGTDRTEAVACSRGTHSSAGSAAVATSCRSWSSVVGVTTDCGVNVTLPAQFRSGAVIGPSCQGRLPSASVAITECDFHPVSPGPRLAASPRSTPGRRSPHCRLAGHRSPTCRPRTRPRRPRCRRRTRGR